MYQFTTGIIATGYVVAAIFFLRFWVRSRDVLFLVFAAAFGLLALNSSISGLGDLARENVAIVYLIRLAAYCLIIAAIVWKNLGSRPPRVS